jgi:predicted nucleic acid-binding protein
MNKMLDPRKTLIAIDSNVLNRDGTDRDLFLDRFVSLSESGSIFVIVTNNVRKEMLNYHTPDSIRNGYIKLVSIDNEPSKEQLEKRQLVRNIINGKGKNPRNDSDVLIVSEAAEQKCGYFITEDRRILNKDLELRVIFPSLDIITLIEFLKIYDQFWGKLRS